jgi:hypothetical protein
MKAGFAGARLTICNGCPGEVRDLSFRNSPESSKRRWFLSFQSQRIPMGETLPDTTSFDSRFMIHHNFREIDSEIAKTRSEARLQQFDLRMHNCPPALSSKWGMNFIGCASTKSYILHIRLTFPLVTSGTLVSSRTD